ncbi:MAG: ribonuclease HI [Candidatus Pacebacteria bacterium]|nr:ribonuclease HI [Candidatus Paceibacterota bacterium]
MKKDTIIAYTDGSSLGNPGPGGWGAIVSFGNKTIIEIGGREEESTNNRMELTAAIEVLRAVKETKADVEIHTDSSYVKNGITGWVYGWQKNNWQTKAKQPVLNRDLWQQLLEEEKRRKKYGEVVWHHVEGHVGHPGNERADEIATSYAKEEKTELFEGKRKEYDIDLNAIDEKAVNKKRVSKSRSRAKAYSYLSLIGGVLEKHTTWGECEARVKGKKAKFKKAISAQDEKDILEEWKISL